MSCNEIPYLNLQKKRVYESSFILNTGNLCISVTWFVNSNKPGICSRSERFWPQDLWGCPVRCATAMVRRWMAADLKVREKFQWKNIPKWEKSWNIHWKTIKLEKAIKQNHQVPNVMKDPQSENSEFLESQKLLNHVTAAWPKSQIRGIGWRDDLNVFLKRCQQDTACHYIDTMRILWGSERGIVNQNIWWLQVSMDQILLVDVTNSCPKVVGCKNSL